MLALVRDRATSREGEKKEDKLPVYRKERAGSQKGENSAEKFLDRRRKSPLLW